MTHALTYDTLPPHSQLRREFADGVLKITATLEEPGPLVRRNALLSAALPSAIISCIIILVGLAVFGMMYQANQRYLSMGLSLTLAVAFVVFCAALFGFVWRIQYTFRIHQIEKALQQTTILAAAVGQLLIETTGPLGAASYELRTIVSIRIGRTDVNQIAMKCLELRSGDGSSIHLLAGRDEIELRWVAKALVSALRLSIS